MSAFRVSYMSAVNYYHEFKILTISTLSMFKKEFWLHDNVGRLKIIYNFITTILRKIRKLKASPLARRMPKRPLFEQPQPLGGLSLLSAAPRGVFLLAATVFGHFIIVIVLY